MPLSFIPQMGDVWAEDSTLASAKDRAAPEGESGGKMSAQRVKQRSAAAPLARVPRP